MQEDRNKISYSKRLEQDLETAIELGLVDVIEMLEEKIKRLKEYKQEYYQTEVKNKKVK